ncbi:hypothetical protein VTK56DRAFT_7766 [Thermocarpiscus australiensis]
MLNANVMVMSSVTGGKESQQVVRRIEACEYSLVMVYVFCTLQRHARVVARLQACPFLSPHVDRLSRSPIHTGWKSFEAIARPL